MPTVRIKENEPFETALRRFKRICEKDNIVSEIRRRESYEKPTWERRRTELQAVKRWVKKLAREQATPARSPRVKKQRRDRD